LRPPATHEAAVAAAGPSAAGDAAIIHGDRISTLVALTESLASALTSRAPGPGSALPPQDCTHAYGGGDGPLLLTLLRTCTAAAVPPTPVERPPVGRMFDRDQVCTHQDGLVVTKRRSAYRQHEVVVCW
ncbi:unnamed protein product, partial [Ectocarpus sp. 4 AP-2014]